MYHMSFCSVNAFGYLVKMKRRAGWSFINLLPFVPSEPAGLQDFSLTLTLDFPPPTLFFSTFFSLSLSDVIVSCPVDADAQLEAVHLMHTALLVLTYRDLQMHVKVMSSLLKPNSVKCPGLCVSAQCVSYFKAV